jgi:hypothetical protein
MPILPNWAVLALDVKAQRGVTERMRNATIKRASYVMT